MPALCSARRCSVRSQRHADGLRRLSGFGFGLLQIVAQSQGHAHPAFAADFRFAEQHDGRIRLTQGQFEIVVPYAGAVAFRQNDR